MDQSRRAQLEQLADKYTRPTPEERGKAMGAQMQVTEAISDIGDAGLEEAAAYLGSMSTDDARRVLQNRPDLQRALMGSRKSAELTRQGTTMDLGGDGMSSPASEMSTAKSWEGGGGFKYNMIGDDTIEVTHPDGRKVMVEKGGQNGKYFDMILQERDKVQAPAGDEVQPPAGDGMADAE